MLSTKAAELLLPRGKHLAPVMVGDLYAITKLSFGSGDTDSKKLVVLHVPR